MKVGIYEAKSKLSHIVDLARRGEEVIITKNGKDQVKLVPVPDKKSWIGMWEGQIKIHDNFDDPLDDDDLALFEDGPIEPPLPGK